MHEEIKKNLEKLALEKTEPFCYSCYRIVKGTHCPTCGSDDNMRHLEGVGVEYGTSWVIDYLIEENVKPTNTDELFEDMIRDCYSETTKVGWLELDTVSIIKDQDPVSYEMARQEYIDSIMEDGEGMEFGGTYYWISDIEEYIRKASS